MSQINVNTIAPQSGSSVTVSGDISATNQTGSIGRIEGATINLTGDLTAKRYIVSSSVTELSVITNSGSTAFGDSLDDTHIYTGSLQLTGSVSASKFIGDGALLSNVFEGTAPSASISTRLTSFTDGTATSVSGSSTSTGSFGRLEIAKEANIGGNLTVQGSNTSMIAGSLGVGTTATNQVNLSSVSTALTINGSSTSIIELAIGGARKANFYSDGTDATIANNSSGKFEFLTDNNYRMSILADGKVGIGTRSPGAQLHVNGGAYNESIIVQGSGVDSGITFKDSAGNIDGYVYSSGGAIGFLDSGGSYAIKHINDSKTEFRVANTIVSEVTATMAISGSSTSTGSFGTIRVGTNPGKLTGGIAFGDGDTGIYENEDDSLAFQRGGSEAFRINTSSQIDFHGIGSLVSSTSQGFKIDTAGTGATTATYTFQEDSNTGIGHASADNLSLIAGGVEQLRIASNTISGSSTSTGSFGHLQISNNDVYGRANGIAIGTVASFNSPSLAFEVTKEIDNNYVALLRNLEGTAGRNFGLYVRAGTNTSDFALQIRDKDDSLLTRVDGAGNLLLNAGDVRLTSGNVSGSSTSTGSFGILQLRGSDSQGVIDFTKATSNTVIGFSNTGLGLASGAAGNTLIGYQVGQQITTGDQNVAIGQENLSQGNCTGNTAVGYRALKSVSTGIGNVGIGRNAADSNQTGHFNIGIGQGADLGSTAAEHRIVIGHDAAATADNQTVIGGSTQTQVVFGGDALISGSAKSTGSFGDGRFASKVGIGLGITTALSTPHSYLDVRGNNVTPSNGNGSYHTMQLIDTSTSAEGVGGGIAFGGKFLGNTDTLFGEIRGLKENGTSNNYAGALTFQTRANGGNLIEQVRIDSSGNLNVQGDITAQNFIVSSSVTSITYQSLSGSTIFGDDTGDTHQFTGSLRVSGSVDVTGSLDAFGDITSRQGHLSLNQNRIFTAGGVEPKFEMSTNAGSAVRIHTSEGSYISVGANFSAFGVGHTTTGKHKLRVDGRGTLRPFGIANDATVIFDVDTAGNVTGSGHLNIAGNISGSLASTGSFGHVLVGGTNIETFISSSAAADGFGGGGSSGGSGDGFPFDGQAQITGSLIISGAIHPMTASLHITDTSFTDTHILSQSLVVAVDGNNGRLFSVTDQMSGSLFSANTVAGLPVIEAFSDNKVTLGPFSNQTVIDSDGNMAVDGNISGSVASTGSFAILQLRGSDSQAVIDFTKATSNTIIGFSNTGAAITTGAAGNTLIGYSVGRQITTGDQNVAIGQECLSQGNNTGNTAVGYRALKSVTTAIGNVGIGRNAADALQSGNFNIGIGQGADLGSTTAEHRIVIGHDAAATADNQTVIGGSTQTQVVFGGDALISGSAASTGSFGQVKGDIIGQRPIVTHIADFSASMDFAGRYNIVHGGLTCSILTHATTAVDNGTEYEFFQTSSLGNMLFETGSGVSLYVKNDNLNIAGQYSGASLKKVATNTWHLVGDLT